MKKKIILPAFFIIFLISGGLIFYYKQIKRVCFRNNCFLVELAKTQRKQMSGLMCRKYLASNRGMLFIFSKEDVYPFWMKNTLIPLDIIWIDKDKKVVFIEKNAQPCTEIMCPQISPVVSAKYVLEINGGLSDTIGLSPGNFLEFFNY